MPVVGENIRSGRLLQNRTGLPIRHIGTRSPGNEDLRDGEFITARVEGELRLYTHRDNKLHYWTATEA